MTAPSVTGGFAMLESCDTGSPGKSMSAMLSGATPLTAARGSGYGTGINSTGNATLGNSSGPNSLQGGIYPVTSTDFSVPGRFLVLHSHASAAVTRFNNLTSSTGVMMYANSGSAGANEAAFPIWGSDAPMPASFSVAIVNLNRSTDAHLYAGGFDPSNITHLGLCADFTQAFTTILVDSIGYVDAYVAINGEIADTSSFNDVLIKISSDDTKLSESPTSSLHHCYFSWGVGDGATLTIFNETLATFEFARQVDYLEPWGRAHINDNELGFQVNASASDIITLELCNFISDTPFYFNSIGSTSASVDYTSCIIKNAGDLTIVDGHSFNGCTFDSCDQVAANNPTLINTALKNSAAASLSIDDDITNLSNVTFSGCQTALKVDIVGNKSINVDQLTFETSNTYYIEYTGAGTLTVNSSVSIPAGKLNATGGGTINVVAPPLTLTIESTEDLTGAEIRIYDDEFGTNYLGTELDGVESSGASTFVSANISAGNAVYIQLFKTGFIEFGQAYVMPSVSSVFTAVLEVDNNL